MIQFSAIKLFLYIGYFSYESVGDSYVLMFNTTMNFKDGQKACQKLHGHILEFDERADPDYIAKLIAVTGRYVHYKKFQF